MKDDVPNSMFAERYGIANALYLADQAEDLSKFRVIVYCDNLKALQKRGFIKHTAKSKYYPKEKAEQDWFDQYIKPYIEKCAEYETRHVKGHLTQDKWHPISKRNFMNDWCDKEAKRVMRAEVLARQEVLRNG